MPGPRLQLGHSSPEPEERTVSEPEGGSSYSPEEVREYTEVVLWRVMSAGQEAVAMWRLVLAAVSARVVAEASDGSSVDHGGGQG